MDVDRILKERVKEDFQLASLDSQLIHYLKEKIAKEMKGLLEDCKDEDTVTSLKHFEMWLEEKTNQLTAILEGKKTTNSKLDKILEGVEIQPASKLYVIINQIKDSAAHFVAEYRSSIR